TCESDSRTHVFFGDGTGEFFRTSDLPIGGYDLEAADLDGDGHVDLVSVENSSLASRLGLGTGDFEAARQFALDCGKFAFDLALEDFDRDGVLDAAVACGNSNTVAILLGDGDGGFGLVGNFDVGNFPLGVTAGDYDEDGNPDFVAANWSGDS